MTKYYLNVFSAFEEKKTICDRQFKSSKTAPTSFHFSKKREDYHESLKTTKLSTFLLISHDIILFDEKLHLKCRR